MNPLATLRIAVRALLRNKLRSFLTALGIIIGVAAVIAMVAIGEGAKSRVEQAFASMGTNMLILSPGSSTAGGSKGGFGSQPTLTWEDLKAIQNEVSTVSRLTPQSRSTQPVMSEDQNWTTRVTGVWPEYFDIRNWGMDHGMGLSQSDVDVGNKVAVLGQTVVEKLYGENADPVGQVVRVRNIPFVVIGVMQKKGQSPVGEDYDDAVFIPYSTFMAKIQGGLHKYVSGSVFIGAVSTEATARAEKQIAQLLRDRHNIAAGQDDDFQIRNLTEMASAQEEGTKTLTTLLASIAAVSLLVGGIGIMNIMLVSVTERTREIGLRMAVGAKPQIILAQFLVEALTLSIMGGAIGVVLGLVGAERLANRFGWPMLIRTDIIGAAVGFSALVGIVFGLYPAHKASQLDPIDALRYE
jgi:putative ABC transport system permease protein